MGFAPFKIGSALRRILVVGLQRTSPDKGVVAGLVSNYILTVLFYKTTFITREIYPHILPHTFSKHRASNGEIAPTGSAFGRLEKSQGV